MADAGLSRLSDGLGDAGYQGENAVDLGRCVPDCDETHKQMEVQQ